MPQGLLRSSNEMCVTAPPHSLQWQPDRTVCPLFPHQRTLQGSKARSSLSSMLREVWAPAASPPVLQHSSGIKRASGQGAQSVRHAQESRFFSLFSFSKILYARLNSKIVFNSLKDTSRSPISYTSRNLWNNAFLDQIKWSQVFCNDS